MGGGVPSVTVCKEYDQLRFSRLVLGTMRFTSWGGNLSDEAIAQILEKCADLGITTIDTADIYGGHDNEEALGRALRLRPGLRERLTVVTKCGIIHPCARRPENTMAMYDSSYEHIMASARRSLQDLQTEYIDVLLIHRPDLLMDPQEVARAFAELHAQNSVRYFGVSNFSPSQLELLQAALPADIRLVTNQIEVSALHIDPLVDGTLDQCLRLGISPMAWSPFGGGRVFAGHDEQSARVRGVAEAVGRELGGIGTDVVLLAWLLRHPAQICPIMGRIEAFAQACTVQMTRHQWYSLLEAARGHPVA